MFEKSIIIVAHPDDDILWLSSVIEKVSEILFCFLDFKPDPLVGPARRKTISDYPLDNVSCLEIEEAHSFNKADWTNPVETKYGLELTRNTGSTKDYAANYKRLYESLCDKLRNYDNVFTHNPWGEYGHEDHVQVYRVLKEIQNIHGYNLWYSNYCSNKSFPLMLNHISGFSSDYITIPTNKELASEIADIYIKNGCWTWYEDYCWFNEESFIKDQGEPGTTSKAGHIFPLNLIKMPIPDLKIKNNISPDIKSRIKNKLSNITKISFKPSRKE